MLQVHIQPFRDMIDGMRMDLVKSRYRTYDELYGYCYKVAGTVALMTTPVMGIDPAYAVRSATSSMVYARTGSHLRMNRLSACQLVALLRDATRHGAGQVGRMTLNATLPCKTRPSSREVSHTLLRSC